MMKPDLRRGWCPSALRPMETGDGLLVRLRLPGGRLSLPFARRLAKAARQFGNGLIDMTSHANLQLRGLSQDTHRALIGDLGEVLDEDPASESIRNIMASPLAGESQFGALLDIRPIIEALDERLTHQPSLRELPVKFTFLIDDGGWPSLANIRAHLRFDASRFDHGIFFAVAVGGTGSSARLLGHCTPENLAEVAVQLALETLQPGDGKANPGLLAFTRPPRNHDLRSGQPIGYFQAAQGQALIGLGISFGRLDADALDLIVTAAEDLACEDLRLTPWRGILLLTARPERLARWRGEFIHRGFCLDPDDPRLAIVACPGAPACRNATTPTHKDALQLAPLARRFATQGIGMHVSGCHKGCACQSPTPVTLVAEEGSYRLIVDGTAQDESMGAPFAIEAAEGVLKALLERRMQ